MAQYGIQWDSNALSGVGQVSWIIIKAPNKFLIKQGTQYYSIKPEFYQNAQFSPITLAGGEIPNEDDYNNLGFDNINDLCVPITVGDETFKPIDKLNTQFQIRMLKQN
ncbi:hypothetical protein [Clostridium sp. HV4-5-A1G]|uniref:hypothetical protein n=1 Tax=Clostridium sp. HV4-5-A1G TaxID=2004595 RepID=UPI001239A302|nr:hypothetical protein [Clostridium sp. HV4-5-A1G]KAA8674912.1 hypothetical protein F3O63_06345 [Clostridium sp. HV4-5-A1G]